MENWYIVRDGKIIFMGTEEQCKIIIKLDTIGNLEIYPESAYIKEA